jgi:hypothetical protein
MEDVCVLGIIYVLIILVLMLYELSKKSRTSWFGIALLVAVVCQLKFLYSEWEYLPSSGFY